MEMMISTDYKKGFVSQSMTETKETGRYMKKKVKLLSHIRNTPENQKYFELQKYVPFKLETVNKNTELRFGKKGKKKMPCKSTVYLSKQKNKQIQSEGNSFTRKRVCKFDSKSFNDGFTSVS